MKLVDKNTKVKKAKIKTIKTKKRKFSDSDSSKKAKRKKEDRLTSDFNDSINENSIKSVNDDKINKNNSENLNNCNKLSSDAEVCNSLPNSEHEENLLKEKYKTISQKKLKVITNVCKETLCTLMKFELDLLQTMNSSLRILKEHNFLTNRFLTPDILIQLIELALQNQGEEEINLENKKMFDNIVSNLATSKMSYKNKTKILSSSSPNVNKSVLQVSNRCIVHF